MIKLYSLASSSSGNSYIYSFDDLNILLDVGISKKVLFNKLSKINFSYEDIREIFITHEHIDHVKGLKVLNKQNNKTINLTKGTYAGLKHGLDNINYIEKNVIKKIDDLIVEPIVVSHDANEPVAFIFYYQNKKIVHLLDTGYIPEVIMDKIDNAYFYVIESNYEEEALITNSNYPHSLKQRISSDLGHLSNKQCNYYINQLIGDRTKIVCFGHLSEKNNDKDLVDIINCELGNVNKYILDPKKMKEILICE